VNEISDRHVEIVRQKLLERSKVGIKKYGVTTDNANLSLQAWLQHLQEELLDASVYVESILNKRVKE
jgi:hypothetical protein